MVIIRTADRIDLIKMLLNLTNSTGEFIKCDGVEFQKIRAITIEPKYNNHYEIDGENIEGHGTFKTQCHRGLIKVFVPITQMEGSHILLKTTSGYGISSKSTNGNNLISSVDHNSPPPIPSTDIPQQECL